MQIRYKTFKEYQNESEQILYIMDDLISQNSEIIPSRNNNKTAHELCRETSLCVRPFANFEARIRVAPKFKMAHCVVHKSMSTVMTSIMCYLYNRTKYSRATQVKKLNEWQKYNLCQSENTYNSVFSVAKAFKFSNWSVSMITRDPVERFVSGYVDRCIRAPKGKNPCNGCDKNLTCFITAEYRKFMAINRKKHVPNTIEDRHFYPQNWRCNLKNLRAQYEFIRYSSDPSEQLMSDLFKIARKQGVPEDSLSFIRDELTANRRTSHTTAESPARTFYENRLRSNPFLMEYVVKMFYHDFVHLRYPFPDGF